MARRGHRQTAATRAKISRALKGKRRTGRMVSRANRLDRSANKIYKRRSSTSRDINRADALSNRAWHTRRRAAGFNSQAIARKRGKPLSFSSTLLHRSERRRRQVRRRRRR